MSEICAFTVSCSVCKLIQFKHLKKLFTFRENFLYRMLESGPCFLKIFGNNTNNMRLDGESIDLNASKLPLERLKTVYDIMRWEEIFFYFSMEENALTVLCLFQFVINFHLYFILSEQIGWYSASDCFAIWSSQLEYSKCDANFGKN